MKNILKKTALLTALILMFSCNNKPKTKFINTPISDFYKIELPDNFEKIQEGFWEIPNTSFNLLAINVEKGVVKSLNEAVENESKAQKNQTYFKDMKFIKSKEFEQNGFRGVISYYEKDNKGKGLGLVSLKSYIIIGVVQDEISNIHFISISLSKNIDDDLTKSIKSISLINPSVAENNFDEATYVKNGFQIFKKENFVIKCLGKLKIDNERIKQFEENNSGKNSTPFISKKDNNEFVINVTDHSNLYSGIEKEKLIKYHSQDMDTYAENLKSVGITYQRAKFKDYDCVYYENTQNNILTKAVFFEAGLNAYLLQVASNKNTNKTFEEFINTFELIKK